MRNLKYLTFIMLLGMAVPSCVEDTAPEDAFGKSPNLVSFANASTSFSAVIDGLNEEQPRTVNLRVKGPSIVSQKEAVTATISIDPASTAIEGVHYRIESTTVTFNSENNYLTDLPIVMLTEGIVPPLEENPLLILNVSAVSGGQNVIPNGKKLTISFNYLCSVELEGTYLVTIDNARCKNATYGPNFPYKVTISPNPDGSWHLTSADGGFLSRCTANTSLPNSGDIVVVCGVVQATDDLENGPDGIGNITGGTWDPATGTLVLKNAQTFSVNWPADWTSTYVRQ